MEGMDSSFASQWNLVCHNVSLVPPPPLSFSLRTEIIIFIKLIIIFQAVFPLLEVEVESKEKRLSLYVMLFVILPVLEN